MACLFATGWRSAGRRHRSEAPPPTVGICVLGSASLRGVSVWPRLRRGGPHDRLGHFHLSRTRAQRAGESSPDSTGAQRARVVSAARVVGRCGSHSAALGVAAAKEARPTAQSERTHAWSCANATRVKRDETGRKDVRQRMRGEVRFETRDHQSAMPVRCVERLCTGGP